MAFYIYVDRSHQWRWTLVAANGKNIADSGEGYYNQADCMNGIQLVMGAGNAPVYRR